MAAKHHIVKDGFTDPLDGTYDDSPSLNVPDKYNSTPEMRAKLMQGLIEDGFLEEVILH